MVGCQSFICTVKADLSVVTGAATTNADRVAERQVMNPPMIHSLAVPPTSDCPAAQLVAAACGGGTIAVWDLDKVLVLQHISFD